MLHYELVPTANDSTPVLVWVKKKSYTAGLVQTHWSSGEKFNKTLENMPAASCRIKGKSNQVSDSMQTLTYGKRCLPMAKDACLESFVSNSQPETKSLNATWFKWVQVLTIKLASSLRFVWPLSTDDELWLTCVQICARSKSIQVNAMPAMQLSIVSVQVRASWWPNELQVECKFKIRPRLQTVQPPEGFKSG